MAEILHLHCDSCGERLPNPRLPYCEPCNLRLAYLAMPYVLGMLLMGRPAVALATVQRGQAAPGRHLSGGYDDDDALAWE